jgi:hypothetical protein
MDLLRRRHRLSKFLLRRGYRYRQGWLVDVDGIDKESFHWKTSVSRSDAALGQPIHEAHG